MDIACGKGTWSYIAAQYSPKSVDGFDIDEEMVQLAKQATSEFNTVNIHVGDMRNMPYDDNMLDVVSGMHVTCICALQAEVCMYYPFQRNSQSTCTWWKSIIELFCKICIREASCKKWR